ncbi:MAG TPA: hypothetical protein ENJ56_06240, partial [Anaerolineae bacterium]|nr:hypothetical protein [Anaerolineae bacterium]
MHNRRIGKLFLAVLLITLVFLTTASQSDAKMGARSADYWIYREGLAGGWYDQSWGTTVNFNNGSPTHAGSRSIALTHSGAWQGFKIGTGTAHASADHSGFEFWIHGGTGGQVLDVVLKDGNDGDNTVARITLTSSGQRVWIDFNDIIVPEMLGGVMLVNTLPNAQPTYYVDDMRFVEGTSGGPVIVNPPPPPTAFYGLSVDLGAPLHTISPDIYGINFGDEALLDSLNATVRRWGGNALTRYNWQLDVSHTASDWYFLNYPSDTDVSQLPNNSSADRYIQANLDTNTQSLITMPTIGWTAKARALDCGFSVAKYGPQQATEPFNPDCGNGIRPDGSLITGVDPHDTSVEVDEQFVVDWITHLKGRFGSANAGGVRYYALDNEPFLWNYTHRDVRPDPVGYDELRDKAYTYGAAIKSADPGAKLFGPALWGA